MYRILFLIGALLAIVLSLAIFFVPGAFYESYGIETSGQVSLLNELKAPAMIILIAGAVIAMGLFKDDWRTVALITGIVFYSAFGLSRVVAIATDGVPASGLVWSMVIELALGAAFAFALWRDRVRQAT